MGKRKEEEQKGSGKLKGEQLLDHIERPQMKTDMADFCVGDTVDVGVKIQEGDKERIQIFTGICIGRRGSGLRETFTVRRIVQGEGVERIFPLHSPVIASVKVVRHGKVRRAKLNYLRQRTGRGTKVREQFEGKEGEEGAATQKQ